MITKLRRVVSWVESDGGGVAHRSFTGSGDVLLSSMHGGFRSYLFYYRSHNLLMC